MKLLHGTDLKRFLKKQKKLFPRQRELVFVLHDVEYPANVGSIFRLADACGVKEVYLSGITPEPKTAKIRKIARYKVKSIRWQKIKDPGTLFRKLRQQGYLICALEVTNRSFFYFRFPFPQKVCLVVGHEDHGLPNKVLKKCDQSVLIPMYGKGKSLNVHVALAIVAYHLLF